VVPPASNFAAVVTTVGDSALVPAAPVLPAADLGPQSTQSFDLDRPLRDARDGFEKAYFEFHLAMENGSMTRVAEKTGLERTHLYRKLKQLGVDLSRGRRSAV
jgi:DNA-binding NtrC family response regulator